MFFYNSIVKIEVISVNIDYNNPLNEFDKDKSSGSGFFYKNNLIITCYHVVENALNINIIYKHNIKKKATIKAIFPDDDIAILEFIDDKNEFNDIIILDFKIINIKDNYKVLSLGFPMDSNNIVITRGIISGFEESFIQTDAAINPGNSGGPLVIYENEKEYKVIGVNVSKLINAENTNYVVPYYRFKILLDKINPNNIIYRKPLLLFNYQYLEQDKILIDNNIENKKGVMVTNINKKFYLYNYIKPKDIILSINNNPINYDGYIKINQFPENIMLSELGRWFVEGDELEFEIISKKEKKKIKIKLEIIKTNLMYYYYLQNFPKYYVMKNNLILAIITNKHLYEKLNITFKQKISIINRYLHNKDLFTVYLVGLENDIYNMKFSNYPIGDIITRINNKKFTNYEEFINILTNDIQYIKTINNEIYYI